MANNDTQRAGDFFSLSQISPIADLGRSMQKRAATELALKNRAPINLGSGVLYDPSTRESSTSKEYQNTLAAKRQHEMDLINARLKRDNEAKDAKRGQVVGDAELKRQQKLADDKIKRQQEIEDRDYKATRALKPSAKTASDMTAMQTVVDDAEDMSQILDENPDSIERWWDLPAQFARYTGADTIGNMIESAIKSPEELSVKQRMNSFVSELRNRLSGSALTTLEASLGSGYLPNASGISQSESKERYLNIVRYLERELNLNKERFGMEQGDITGDNQTPEFANGLDDEIARLEAELNQ